MSQEQVAHVPDADALLEQAFAQPVEARRRPGIYQRDAGRGVDHNGRDDPGEAEKVKIHVIEAGGKGRHGQSNSITAAPW